jgi:hypothetical protein
MTLHRWLAAVASDDSRRLLIVVWMNASRVGPNGCLITERDLTLDYTHAFGSWTLSGGWINYTFVDVSVDRYSNEFCGSLAYAGYFSPTLPRRSATRTSG